MTTISRRRLNAGGTTRGFTSARRVPDFGGPGARIGPFHFRRTDVGFPLYRPSGLSKREMDDKQSVKIEDETDRWRFTCPRGHRDWEPTNHHFWCASCARVDGVDGVFQELRDKRDGGLLAREDVQLLTPVGPYDRDLDGRGSA